jgi:hypothetical protein
MTDQERRRVLEDCFKASNRAIVQAIGDATVAGTRDRPGTKLLIDRLHERAHEDELALEVFNAQHPEIP